MTIKSKIQAIPVEILNSNNLDPVLFTAVTDPLPEACSLVFIVNDTSQSIEISYDGMVGHDYLVENSERQLYIGGNSYQNIPCLLAKGTVIYARGTPGTGFVAVSGYYQ